MKSGFSFIEVMLALAITTVAITTVSHLQFRALERVQRNSELINKVISIKRRLSSFLYDKKKCNQLENMKPFITKDEETDFKMVTSLAEIDKKSSLTELKNLLFIIKTEGSWKHAHEIRGEKIISFIAQTPKKEDQTS